MTHREAGYATVTVAAVLSALSITSVGFMHLSHSTTANSARLSSDILVDGALEEALAATLTSLVNLESTIEDYPIVTTLSGSDLDAQTSVETERDKLGLNSAETTDFTDALANSNIRATYHLALSQAFRRAVSRRPAHTTVRQLLPDGATSGLADCLRSTFTEHKVPAVFKRDNQRHLLNGEIYRIKIETKPESHTPRVLDVAVLFTGDDRDPVWVLNWDRYSISKKECKI